MVTSTAIKTRAYTKWQCAITHSINLHLGCLTCKSILICDDSLIAQRPNTNTHTCICEFNVCVCRLVRHSGNCRIRSLNSENWLYEKLNMIACNGWDSNYLKIHFNLSLVPEQQTTATMNIFFCSYIHPHQTHIFTHLRTQCIQYIAANTSTSCSAAYLLDVSICMCLIYVAFKLKSTLNACHGWCW